jgi:hypothetical protein
MSTSAGPRRPRPQRQNRRIEADPIDPGGAAVPHLRPGDLHGADAGLNLPRRSIAVPDQPGPAVGQYQVGRADQKRVDLNRDRLASRSRAPARRISVSGSSTVLEIGQQTSDGCAPKKSGFS